MHAVKRIALTLPLALGLALAGCSKDPEVAKREHLKSGNAYFEAKKYPEAIIEYRNAIQQDPRFGDARFKLAEALRLTGDEAGAYREYVRAADLLPNSFPAQLRAAQYLLVAGRQEDAKARAEKAYALNRRSVDALVVIGAALANMRDLDAAVKQMKEAIDLEPGVSGTYSNLGLFELARGDKAEAEKAFARAVEVDPKSPDALIGLASFYWASGRVKDAEDLFKQAVAAHPQNARANGALATLYVSSGRAALAEPYLKTVAETTKDADSQLSLAAYYRTTKRDDDAVRVLNALANSDEKAYATAKTRVAQIQYARREPAAAHATIDDVLKRHPRDAGALAMKGRFLLAEGKVDDALATARAAVAAEPGSVAAQLLLGRVQLARREFKDAIDALNQVTTLNPGFWPARVDLARALLQSGRAADAIAVTNDILKVQGDNPVVLQLRARALLAKGDTAGSEADIRKLASSYPKAAVVHAQLGSTFLAKRDYPQARAAFERALALDAAQPEALQGLVAADLGEKKPAHSVSRIDAALAAHPGDARLLKVAARAYASTGDLAKAEITLNKALELHPGDFQVYTMLGELYVRQNRLQRAIAEYDRIAQLRPKDVAPATFAAMLVDSLGNRAEAIQRYERVLQVNPKAAVAANNLAFLYAEAGQNLDVALALAQTAKAELPESPEVSDTLGWVYYKKGLATLAVPAFRESIEKDPRNPSYHFHLGLAYQKTGDAARARQSLEQALALNPAFRGADDARKALQLLKG